MATPRVKVEPRTLEWALRRGRRTPENLRKRFPRLDAWLAGEHQPTLKQLEDFATATNTALGLLMLREPPTEALPIPDFRTMRDVELAAPSADLLDTIYACERRQAWFKEHVRFEGREDDLAWIGQAGPSDSPEMVADALRVRLGFDMATRSSLKTWEAALRLLVDRTEALGVLVMVNGVVGTNTHRKLDPQEFRGFVLADSLAPLIFVNGADTKSAQMFTLAHELAHLCLGASGVSDVAVEPEPMGRGGIESWCNRVAADLLVPAADLHGELQDAPDWSEEIRRLARRFKVSTLVVLRRLREMGVLGDDFWEIYRREEQRVTALAAKNKSTGGDFYLTHPRRVSPTFAQSVIASAMEGTTLYREAMQLLGLRSVATFERLGREVGLRT